MDIYAILDLILAVACLVLARTCWLNSRVKPAVPLQWHRNLVASGGFVRVK